MTDKKSLRITLLQYRRLLSGQEFQKRNQNLCDQVLQIVSRKKISCIHTFLPIARNHEFDIRPIVPRLLENEGKLMTSVTDFKAKTMTHFWFNKVSIFEENPMGIPEPVNAKQADIHEADAVLVPLLAADKSGNRIGYGGGFYDRLLKDFNGISIGICLSSLFDSLGTNEWDVPVNETLFYYKSSQIEKPS